MAAVHTQKASLTSQNQSLFWDYQITENGYDFEQVDIRLWRDYMSSRWAWAFYAAGIYLVTIFGLQRYMKNRPAYSLRTPLIWWNAALGVFSIVGFVRTAPTMGKYMTDSNTLFSTICNRDFTETPMAYWGIAFAISKFVELGDTVFIVLRKRPLQLLQWYHHIVTLIVVWISMPYAEPVGRWFIIMNYGVHSVMYPYFALKMAGIDVPKVISNMITTAQFSQMIIGFVLNAATIGLQEMGFSCYRHTVCLWTIVAVYASFMVLFGKLFVDSVIKTKGEKHKTK